MRLLEGTNLSEGLWDDAGCSRRSGAPLVDPSALTDARRWRFPASCSIPTRFRPMFDKHAGVRAGA